MTKKVLEYQAKLCNQGVVESGGFEAEKSYAYKVI